MIKGLYHKLAQCQDALAAARETMRDDRDPGSAHNAGARARAIEADISRIRNLIDDDLLLIACIDACIDRLGNMTLTTSHRTLTTVLMEDAQSRLMRELGDHPAK